MDDKDPNRGEELLNVAVEIGEGQTDVLRVFEHDDLQLVVRNFFIKNNIVSESEDAFLERVSHFMEELIEEHKLINQALAVMPVFKSPVCKNFGERLYRKCMQEKEMKIVKHQMERIQKARSIQDTMQDRPKIDSKSVSIVSNSIYKSVSTIKHQSSDVDISEILFTPKTHESLSKGLSEAFSQNPRKQSYSEAKTRESLSPEKPFHLKNRKSQVFEVSSTDRTKSQALLKITQHVKIGVDQETGSKVFQPVLHSSKFDSKKKIAAKLIIHHKGSSEPDIDLVQSPSKKSEIHSNPSKTSRYSEIFEKLKGKSGKIDLEDLKLQNLDEKTAKILEPLLRTLKNDEKNLDFSQFSSRLDDPVLGLNVAEKRVLCGSRVASVKKSMHKHSMSTGSFGSSRENASKRTDYSEKSKPIIVETRNFSSFSKISPTMLRK
jgi:hypothetical protein